MDKQEVLEELKEALAHLSDVAQLADSALAAAILPQIPAEAVSRGMQLRSILTELIDGMKPLPDVPENASEWRQYTILRDRYILHRPLWELEHKLSIGERQVRREHSRGLAILAEVLYARLATTSLPEPATTPAEAIERLTPVPRLFSLAQLMEEVLALLSIAGKLQENQVQLQIIPDDLSAYADRGILRQLLTRLILMLVGESHQNDAFTLEAQQINGTILVSLYAGSERITLQEDSLQLCRLMAQVLDTHLLLSDYIESRHTAKVLQFNLPRESRLHKVLVIDDELTAIELFQSYVTGLDFQVVGVTNAEDALSRAMEVQPDVIIIDVMMPDIDGWELLQRLRLTAPFNQTPIIICSVLGESDLAGALGATAFLKKPILRAQLIKALKQVTK